MDMITGEVRKHFTTHLNPVRLDRFSPDGTKLVAGQFQSSRFGGFDTDSGRVLSQSQGGTARPCNTASARSVAELPICGAEVKFSQDGRRLLCEDQEVG